jgi:hypothetical protein
VSDESCPNPIERVVAGIRLRKTRQDPLGATDPTPRTPAAGLRRVVARPSSAPSGALLGRDNGNGNDERSRPNYTLDGTPTIANFPAHGADDVERLLTALARV